MVVETTTSRSSSSTVVRVRCYHVVKIDGYSRSLNSHGGRPAFGSSPFRAGGHTWHVSYRPMGSSHHPENTRFVSFFLVLDDVPADGEAVMAQVSFSLLRQDGSPAETRTSDVNNFSVSRDRAFGYEEFITRQELERSEFLKDDCFSVRVHVHAVKQQPKPYVITVPPPDLHRHLGDLLSSKEDADVEFEVAGETFAAHRVVLAARSQVFMAELLGPMSTNNNNAVIRVHDMEPQVFDALLAFVYTDEWPELKEEDEAAMTQHLLVAADRYGLHRLKLMCQDRLRTHISSVDSAATILALAEQHCCPHLKDACFEFFIASSTAVTTLESKEFEFLAQSCPTVVEELARILEKNKL
ncbi:hypothetical protein PR202_gb10310 [Eleusine coracana subsp. coracana]|uniref:Uncharacterized protein n=1 Tax=Eleusine coracana subsp. coracana TaxID=191504 RepID=A0AAV5EJ69_ELECO|nr:hypothetical protein QOZ80_3BG0254100 [Eleusine coracana subsp. coracana]GJN22715.1 hypothetical protein PR202_gb10310 [Eleusine coracana subsp. coracana]